MSFACIDPALFAWARRKSVHIATEYKECPVRSFDVVSRFGVRFQVWLEPPAEQVLVHVWDYDTRRAEFAGPPDEVTALLDEAHTQALTWMVSAVEFDWTSSPDASGRVDEVKKLLGRVLRFAHEKGHVSGALAESLARRLVHQGTLSLACIPVVKELLRAGIPATQTDGTLELIDSITLACLDHGDILRAPMQGEIRAQLHTALGAHFAKHWVPQSETWNRLRRAAE